MRRQNDVKTALSFVASGAALMSGNVSFGDLFDEDTRAENSASLASRLVYLKKIG